MARVRFVPLGKEREVRAGATILSAANHAHVPIGQSCSGDGICGWCKVRILEGGRHLAPPGERERKLFATYGYAGNERAACQARVHGDVSVTTSYW